MGDKSGRIRFFQDSEFTKEVDFCDPSLNLLALEQAIELEIGSRCGGHGECGGDRIRVQAEAGVISAVTAAEREHLTIAAAIQAEVEVLEKRLRTEDARWHKEKERLETALRRARS